MKFKTAYLAIAAVLLVHVPLVAIGAYNRWPNIDIPMHLAGGFAMGLLAIALHDNSRARGPWWERALFVVGFVALIAIFWEFYEFTVDAVFIAARGGIPSQLSLVDTLGDLLNGLIGATACYFVLGKRPMKR